MNHLTVQQLSAALDGALGGPSLELVVHHLAHCHECRERQSRLARNDDVMRRLLALDPHEFFLDDLERRVEALLVAIMRGLPVPPMVTTSPLLADEDPFQPAEPPLPDRPELGRAGSIAHEAGFGRIGLKPTGSAQPPQADPEDAKRLLEALERGETGDFTELTAQGMQDHTAIDGPVFDLPGWIKQSAPKSPGAPARPRQVQKLDLFFDHLDDRSANLPHEAVEETFRRARPDPLPPEPPAARSPEPPALSAPAAPASQRPAALPLRPSPESAFQPPAAPASQPSHASAFQPPATPVSQHLHASAFQPPAAPASQPSPASAFQPPATPVSKPSPASAFQPPAAPASRATPAPGAPAIPASAPRAAAPSPVPAGTPRPQAPEVVSKETPWRKSGLYANPFATAAPPIPPPHAAPVTDAYEVVSDKPRKPVPRVKPTPRFAGAWLLATASVGSLLVLVLTLQFLPPASTPGATAWRGLRLPGWEFAPGDSMPSTEPGDLEPTLRAATTPVPVESPVYDFDYPPFGTLSDSTGVIPDTLAATADTLGKDPGR